MRPDLAHIVMRFVKAITYTCIVQYGAPYTAYRIVHVCCILPLCLDVSVSVPFQEAGEWYWNVTQRLQQIPNASDRYKPTCTAIQQLQV